MKPAFEGAVIEDFADLVEQGLVYRALKPVHWSIANRTALAEAELEYEDRQDLSVYVDFEAADREAVERVFGCELDCTPASPFGPPRPGRCQPIWQSLSTLTIDTPWLKWTAIWRSWRATCGQSHQACGQ